MVLPGSGISEWPQPGTGPLSSRHGSTEVQRGGFRLDTPKKEGKTPREEALRLQQEEAGQERGTASRQQLPSALHPLGAAVGEKPRSPGNVPLGGLREAGLVPWYHPGFLWGDVGAWAAGKPLVGAWQPPKWAQGSQGAARELAQLQEPSSRGGGGGVVITASLQPNHPSFIANSSPQARMGFFFLFFPALL